MSEKIPTNPILHVLVIGFHHKRGCQVEYAYPPLCADFTSESNECPPGWKYLPTLALPDGSHNYTSDTVYFHLPSLDDPNQTVFGISCYRQIPVEKVKNRTSDLTRGTVQKAVCVLSVIPLYGHIEVKMSLITQAYFEEGDFTKVSLLKDTFDNLNLCLKNIEDITSSPKFFVGLSARDFVLRFRHKAVLLFKLLLLEKKVIFYCSPVQTLCSTILSLLSLHPGMLESGLHQSASFKPSRPMSPMPSFKDDEEIDIIPTCPIKSDSKPKPSYTADLKQQNVVTSSFYVSYTRTTDVNSSDQGDTNQVNIADMCDRLPNEERVNRSEDANEEFKNSDYDVSGDVSIQTNVSVISELDVTACGTPLQIFTEGYLCLPYLSLPYMDVLLDPNVRGFVVGATNVLFKQKKQLTDILIEVHTGKIETDDIELKRLLNLSMEDLRFGEHLVKNVCEEKQELIDGVVWEGGDEWIRMQFKIYLFSLLRTSLLPENSRELDYFNASFVSAWKDTNNYKAWVCDYGDSVKEISPCHPFAGQLSVADVKLKLSQLQYSEGGKKFNQAMVSVGGAFSQARGKLTSLWANVTNVPTNKATIGSLSNSNDNGTEVI